MGEKILADITDVLRKKGKSERMEARARWPVPSLTWRPCWDCWPHTRAACPSSEVKICTCRAGGGTLWSHLSQRVHVHFGGLQPERHQRASRFATERECEASPSDQGSAEAPLVTCRARV